MVSKVVQLRHHSLAIHHIQDKQYVFNHARGGDVDKDQQREYRFCVKERVASFVEKEICAVPHVGINRTVPLSDIDKQILICWLIWSVLVCLFLVYWSRSSFIRCLITPNYAAQTRPAWFIMAKLGSALFQTTPIAKNTGSGIRMPGFKS